MGGGSVSVVRAADIAAFQALAASFAQDLRPGDVVALEGPLGSGKTTFVAAVVRALDNPAEVASPTFTFWHRYGGSPPVEHLDLFRLENPAEASELGLEEAFGPDRIALVEWPDRLPGFVPANAIRLRIAGSGDGPRRIEIERPAAAKGPAG
jgi:tRNA threonylcarbamoyladenosine biosynthesis protein TsaE